MVLGELSNLELRVLPSSGQRGDTIFSILTNTNAGAGFAEIERSHKAKIRITQETQAT